MTAEGALAVTEQNRNGAIAAIGHRQVGMPVSTEVGRNRRVRLLTDGERLATG